MISYDDIMRLYKNAEHYDTKFFDFDLSCGQYRESITYFRLDDFRFKSEMGFYIIDGLNIDTSKLNIYIRNVFSAYIYDHKVLTDKPNRFVDFRKKKLYNQADIDEKIMLALMRNT